MRAYAAVAALLLATYLAGCDAAPHELELGGSWSLVRSDTDAGHWVFRDGVGPTLNLDVGQATSGCSLYTISVTTTGEAVDFTASARGEMRCAFDIEDPFKGRFGALLRSVEGLEHRDGRLVLTGKRIRLVFETTNRLY